MRFPSSESGMTVISGQPRTFFSGRRIWFRPGPVYYSGQSRNYRSFLFGMYPRYSQYFSKLLSGWPNPLWEYPGSTGAFSRNHIPGPWRNIRISEVCGIFWEGQEHAGIRGYGFWRSGIRWWSVDQYQQQSTFSENVFAFFRFLWSNNDWNTRWWTRRNRWRW